MLYTNLSCITMAVVAAFLCGQTPAISAESQKAEPIVIGDISSFTTYANVAIPHKMGVDMAVEEINAAGGVLGRSLEIRRRDDNGRPEDVIRLVIETTQRDNAVAITGYIMSHIAMAASQVCEREKVSCLATYAMTDKLLGEAWNPWMFRIAPSTTVMARVSAEQASKMPMKRLAIAAPQFEFGVSLTEAFKKELLRLSPQVEIVGEQWSPVLKLNAAPVTAALRHYHPDTIFSAHIGADQARFVREGMRRDLFKDVNVITYALAQKQSVGELLKEVPAGWLSLCHSPTQITIPDYAPFRKAYLAKYDKEPDEASVFGYSIIYAIKSAIEKSGTTDRVAVRDALEGLTWGTPLGEVTFRKFDHQSNMPFFYGKTTGDGSGLPLCNDMKQADPWAYWPRPDDELPEVLKARMK